MTINSPVLKVRGKAPRLFSLIKGYTKYRLQGTGFREWQF